MHAIAAAREAADPEFAHPRRAPGLVVYTSEQAHSSIEKGAIAVGIGQEYVRKIPVDGEFRMRPDALAPGHRKRPGAPACARAASPPPSAPLPPPASTPCRPSPISADEHGLWLHVDAAYAGSAALAPEFAWAFEGCERADSFVTNPHKWLLTPMDCSVFYTGRPEVLRRAFSLVPEYLQTAGHPRAVNLMDYGVPLGRRFRALKLWFVMRSYGREGLAEMLREPRPHGAGIRRRHGRRPALRARRPRPVLGGVFPLSEAATTTTAVILERVNASGEVFLSSTVLHGRFILHLAVGNYATRPEHVHRAWELLSQASSDMRV